MKNKTSEKFSKSIDIYKRLRNKCAMTCFFLHFTNICHRRFIPRSFYISLFSIFMRLLRRYAPRNDSFIVGLVNPTYKLNLIAL